MFARSRGRSTPGPLTSTPSTRRRPDWIASSRFTQRIRVLLPEPLGPQTTRTSPRATVRSTSRRTCSFPNHLFTRSKRMLNSADGGGAPARTADIVLPGPWHEASRALSRCRRPAPRTAAEVGREWLTRGGRKDRARGDSAARAASAAAAGDEHPPCGV
jgi:hypothetical protein